MDFLNNIKCIITVFKNNKRWSINSGLKWSMGPVLPPFLPFSEKPGRGEMEISVLRVLSLFSTSPLKLQWALYQEGTEVATFFEIIMCECEKGGEENISSVGARANTLALFSVPPTGKSCNHFSNLLFCQIILSQPLQSIKSIK
jgi:hypothetical protein